MKTAIQRLIDFINISPTSFHVVENIKQILIKNNYKYLSLEQPWQLETNEKYFTIQSDSALIAFQTPKNLENVEMHLVASHSDSPSFKLKPNYLLKDCNYVRFNTEPYGGALYATFMDRPLGIAGRVIEQTPTGLKTRLVNLDQTVIIPSVAIHMNREANINANYNPQVDMLPLLQLNKETTKNLQQLNNIVAHDLFLYNKQTGILWGENDEFVSSPRLDDLECAYASIESLLEATNENLNIAVVFNHEEVSSQSDSGAASNFLERIIKKIFKGLGLKEEKEAILSRSMIVSADNAHAIHPNHPEKSDATNAPVMNKGIVVKHQAGLLYTTTALSASIFKNICKQENIPTQDFTNRSDMRGGSTLGAILLSSLSIPSVDIGLAQLAMHSSYETAGTKDFEEMIKALKAFYNTQLKVRKVLINE